MSLMTDEAAFARMRELAPSAREITAWRGTDRTLRVNLKGSTDQERERVQSWLTLYSPHIGPTQVTADA